MVPCVTEDVVIDYPFHPLTNASFISILVASLTDFVFFVHVSFLRKKPVNFIVNFPPKHKHTERCVEHNETVNAIGCIGARWQNKTIVNQLHLCKRRFC